MVITLIITLEDCASFHKLLANEALDLPQNASLMKLSANIRAFVLSCVFSGVFLQECLLVRAFVWYSYRFIAINTLLCNEDFGQ